MKDLEKNLKKSKPSYIQTLRDTLLNASNRFYLRKYYKRLQKIVRLNSENNDNTKTSSQNHNEGTSLLRKNPKTQIRQTYIDIINDAIVLMYPTSSFA